MKETWTSALTIIQSRVSRENFATYFEPLSFVGCADDCIELAVEDAFFADWVRLHYQRLLDEALSEAAGTPLRAEIRVVERLAPLRLVEASAVAPSPSAPVSPPVESTPEVVVEDPRWSRFPLNPHYTFDTFVVGPNNEMAHAASMAVGRDPAKAFNPLFIYGGTGLGKTHLLHAIAARVLKDNPTARVCYLSAEEFTNQVIKSIHGGEMEAFRRQYRTRCDVLLMDDVHILAGKDRTQEEFFYTFNALHGAGKQIVLTSDKTPQDIPHLEDRLRSRFNWGLITDIKAPQFETRVAILQRRAFRDAVELPDDVAFFLAKAICRNVRELEGALTRLTAYASFNRRVLTVEFARNVLSEILDATARAVTLDGVQKLVAEHFDVKVADLRGKRRHRAVSHPRSIAMYLCRKHTQASYPQIGRGFGGKDHSTVMAACRKIDRALTEDRALRQEVEAIERKLPS